MTKNGRAGSAFSAIVERVGGTRLAVVGLVLVIGILLLGVVMANSCGETADESRATAGPEPAAGTTTPPSASDAQAAVDTATDCAATDLVEVELRMQPTERGDRGVRTLGTAVITTTSDEPLRVWLLVDEGEEGGAQDWQRESWQVASGLVSAGAPAEERVSQTDYDDGGSTWRIINEVSAWRTGGACADVAPTDEQKEQNAALL